MGLLHYGPGSALPLWVETLDRTAFGEAWTALDDDEALWGFQGLAFARWRVVPAIQEAELLRIAVLPEARSRGLGRDLLSACQDRLGLEGILTLHLEVRVSNTPARRLYEALGWKATGLRPKYYRDGEDAALYTFMQGSSSGA